MISHYDVTRVDNKKKMTFHKHESRKSKVSFKDPIEIISSASDDSSHYESPYTMTEEILQKRYSQTNTGRFITQFCAAIVACLSSFSFGTLLGWSRIDFPPSSAPSMTCTEESWVVSLMPLGCSLAFIPSFYIMNSLGPKKTMVFDTTIYILSFLIVVRTGNQKSFIVSRFVTGFVGTIYFCSAERLLMDAVHRKNLTYMLVLVRLSLLLGLLASYIFGYFKGRAQLIIFCTCIPIVNLLLLMILPESPAFLYKKNERQAMEALQWYLGADNIYNVMHCLQSDADKYRSASDTNRYILFSKCVTKALLLVTFTNFFKAFSGYYVFVLYSLLNDETRLIVFSEFTDSTIFLTTILVMNALVGCIRCIINFGVRKPLILSSTIVTCALLAETAYLYMIYLEILDQTFNQKFGVQIIILTLFVVGYTLGFEYCPDVLLYDYLPFQVQTIAKYITRTLYWFFIFILTRSFIFITSCVKHHFGLLMLSAVSTIGVMYCYIFIIETKGKNLLQIQIEIGGNPIGNRGAYRSRIDVPLMQDAL